MRRIDADSLIERLKPYKNKYGGESFPYDVVHDAFIYEIDQEPTIDAEPVRHGKWILWDGKYDSGYCICSRCNRPTGVVDAFQTYKYCPFCGAKMQARCKLDAS